MAWFIIKSDTAKNLYWHNGKTGGYSLSMIIDTKTKNGIILLSNLSAFNTHNKNIDNLCFELMQNLEKE